MRRVHKKRNFEIYRQLNRNKNIYSQQCYFSLFNGDCALLQHIFLVCTADPFFFVAETDQEQFFKEWELTCWLFSEYFKKHFISNFIYEVIKIK